MSPKQVNSGIVTIGQITVPLPEILALQIIRPFVGSNLNLAIDQNAAINPFGMVSSE